MNEGRVEPKHPLVGLERQVLRKHTLAPEAEVRANAAAELGGGWLQGQMGPTGPFELRENERKERNKQTNKQPSFYPFIRLISS